MQRVFQPFHKLQWQLSLSYLLVVVIATPILFGTGLALVTLTPSPTPAQQLVQLLSHSVMPLVPHPIDSQDAAARSRLNVWASNFVLNQHPVKEDKSLQVPQLNAAETLAVVVIDSAGRVAGSNPALSSGNTAIDPASLAFFLQKLRINGPAAQQVIQAALANEQNLTKLVNTLSDGQTLAAAPLLDTRQDVNGVLFVSVRGLRNDPQASSLLSKLLVWLPGREVQPGTEFTTFLPYALLLLLICSVIGTIFGMLTARRITRRLQRITSAAHAWSEGNFQVHVSDQAADELGQLTQDLNRMAQHIEKLFGAQQQLASLEERQRVARDLHDSVKQQAFALTLLIGAAQSHLLDNLPAAQTQLQKAGELSDQIRQELTAILQQLRPVALTEQNLQTALRAYLAQWSQQTGTVCEYQATSPSAGTEAAALHPAIEEALFRVLQEALGNVARHSQASRVQVQFAQEPDQVCLRITDNGKGFALEQATDNGHGLANMRERVEEYGGTFHISSMAGETVVTGCISLAQKMPRRRKRESM